MNTFLKRFVILFCIGLVTVSCSKDDDAPAQNDFVVAFKNPSKDFSAIDVNQKNISLTFSGKAPANGTISLSYTGKNLVYGEDFTTTPKAENGVITLPIEAGANQVEFEISKLNITPSGEEQAVKFTVSNVNIQGVNGITQGNTSITVSFSGASALGGTMNPEVGGPNEPNQVYIDLSSTTATVVKRDTWDLGFYSGDKFRVTLNGSIFMFAGALNTTDIDAVTSADVQGLREKMNELVSGSNQYVDDPHGDITKTAIKAIKANSEDNPVYLLKLGNEIGTKTPKVGSVALSGDVRGYRKIRILRKDNGYLLQYAKVDAKTHKEVFIPKKTSYNFSFFSFDTESIVDVQPPQNEWDLNFTTSTQILELPASYGGGKSAYGFSDFVRSNRLGGVKVAVVKVGDKNQVTYDQFTIEHVNDVTFTADAEAIGDSWRNVFEHQAAENIFYIVKDPQNNYYKLKFTALVNADGERGHPEFKYALLN